MVSVIDLGLLQLVDFVFPFLLVWAFVYALLHKFKLLGESPAVNALVATAMGFTVLLSRTVIDLINFMIPWFAIAIIFFILMVLLFMIMGAKEPLNAYSDKSLQWLLIAIGIIIVFAAFGKVMGQSLLEQASQQGDAAAGEEGAAGGSFQENIYATLFHPKVLGLIVIFAIAVFTVALLSG
ncbi:MAG: hypothetical protein AABX64_00925 [Nanoarchaeota archaeon]